MSKIVNFGTLCGGVGGLIAGVLAAVQFLSGPPKIDDTGDLANSIIELADAVSLSNVTVNVSQVTEITNALTELNTQVAIAATTDDGMLPFVPQSFTGVSDQPFDVPYDLVAGNGSSRLIILHYNTASHIKVTADGEYIGRMQIGGNEKIEIGSQVCTMELIAVNGRESARIRTICE